MNNVILKKVCTAAGFCLTFFLLVQGYFLVTDRVVQARAGLNTQEQIQMQFENAVNREYDCLILGNSRTYRGINPEKMSVAAYNFSHDNDNYNQMYWKLIYLEQNGVEFDHVVLGTDYFMFSFLSDTRNTYYGELLPEAYLQDYDTQHVQTEKIVWHEQMNNNFNAYIVRKFQQPLEYVVATISGKENQRIYLKNDGQYVDPLHKASDADTVQRDGQRLQVQEDYFLRILTYCAQKGIHAVVVMPPVRNVEMANYSQEFLQEFDAYLGNAAQQYGVTVLNYSQDQEFKATELFSDVTHLCPAGADLWTQKLDADLKVSNFYVS